MCWLLGEWGEGKDVREEGRETPYKAKLVKEG